MNPPPVGLQRRFAAIFCDTLLVGAVLYFAIILVRWWHGGAIPPDRLWVHAWLVPVAWFYFGFSWTRGGQTLGMRAWRCRLVTIDGRPVGWWRSVERFAAAAVSWACLGLGFWASLADPERRTWHDRWTGTVIVQYPPGSRDRLGPPAGGAYHGHWAFIPDIQRDDNTAPSGGGGDSGGGEGGAG